MVNTQCILASKWQAKVSNYCKNTHTHELFTYPWYNFHHCLPPMGLYTGKQDYPACLPRSWNRSNNTCCPWCMHVQEGTQLNININKKSWNIVSTKIVQYNLICIVNTNHINRSITYKINAQNALCCNTGHSDESEAFISFSVLSCVLEFKGSVKLHWWYI